MVPRAHGKGILHCQMTPYRNSNTLARWDQPPHRPEPLRSTEAL